MNDLLHASQCLDKIATVSTDSPVITFIFLIYSVASCQGNVSNSKVTMKFAQLHYFLSQNIGGTKDIMPPPFKSWRGHFPPSLHKLGPCYRLIHARVALKSYFCNFLTSCMRQLEIPKIWRRALILAVPKSEKPLGDSKSYCPMSLLYVPFKLLERLIYACVKPIIDPWLPQE